MSASDWRRVIDEIAGLGARVVQFIGGEPTTHPSFASLVDYASSAGLDVEVFSNLVRVRSEWWDPLIAAM